MDRNAQNVLHQRQTRIGRRAKATQAVAFFNLLTSPQLLEMTEALLPAHRERLYPPTVALSMFMRQVLQADAVWMEVGLINLVPTNVQRDVLVFDWWIQNCDRLTGNTNLLIDAAAKKLVVIDHNLAFDRQFSAEEFLAHHVFAANWPAICSDLVVQEEYSRRLSAALEGLSMACHNVREEWRWANAEMDVPANFDLQYVQQTLSRCTTPELWSPV